MCGIVGYIGPKEAVDFLDRRSAAAGVPRLRQHRRRRRSTTASSTITKTAGRIDDLAAKLQEVARAGAHRHRPHALGHARPGDRRERPSARRRRRRRGARAQRRHRELPRAQGAAGRAGLRLQDARPTPKSSPIWSPASSMPNCATPTAIAGRSVRAAGRSGAGGARAAARHLRPGDGVPRLAGRDRRRPAGQPAGDRRRRRRALHRQRRLAAGRPHRPDRLPGRS